MSHRLLVRRCPGRGTRPGVGSPDNGSSTVGRASRRDVGDRLGTAAVHRLGLDRLGLDRQRRARHGDSVRTPPSRTPVRRDARRGVGEVTPAIGPIGRGRGGRSDATPDGRPGGADGRLGRRDLRWNRSIRWRRTVTRGRGRPKRALGPPAGVRRVDRAASTATGGSTATRLGRRSVDHPVTDGRAASDHGSGVAGSGWTDRASSRPSRPGRCARPPRSPRRWCGCRR